MSEAKAPTLTRVKILRGCASAEGWSVEPGQVLELRQEIVDQLIRAGHARHARPDEPISFATSYEPA